MAKFKIFVISGCHGVGKTSIWSEVVNQLGLDIVPIGEFARGVLEDGFMLETWHSVSERDPGFYFKFEKILLRAMDLFWDYWCLKQGNILVCDRSFVDIFAYCRTYISSFETEKLMKSFEKKYKNIMFTFLLRRESVEDKNLVSSFYYLLEKKNFYFKNLDLPDDFDRKEVASKIVDEIKVLGGVR